ncbi:MAG: family 43 glycosylhydrolase [Planctomycetales bacterium]|nr:family 43 glycosylhydrolase [Planctomycetales bacterium]
MTRMLWVVVGVMSLVSSPARCQESVQRRLTYCNPINVDYGFCPIPNFVEHGKHRATADPVIVVFRGDYYLFSTNQWGYWWSSDMVRWHFVPRKFLKPRHQVYDELCAPAAFVLDDALYVIGSTHGDDFTLWKSSNPRVDDWTVAVEKFAAGAWDPAFFVDDDQRIYLYYGSSNTYPLYGIEIDRQTLQPKGDRKELIRLHDDLHGWERFGEANDNTFLRPFMEGAWMNKVDGRYYLQYGAPGTEFSGYADGVYVGSSPLGPFAYQQHNPFCAKPGGFARGAGHGATYQSPKGQWWHTSTITIAVKNNFERRIGIWPAGFDDDGVLYCDTAYGDYPHYVTQIGEGTTTVDTAERSATTGRHFTGWMLLNYAKPVRVSSTLGGYSANFAVDEDIKSYWSAQTASAEEWIESDLGETSRVHAFQINYADQDATVMGKVPGLSHKYRVLVSNDGQQWQTLIDKSNNNSDVPHEYVELPEPVSTRFVRLENEQVPTGKFAISGLRVFGRQIGDPPGPVSNFVVLRGDSERRNAWLKWQADPEATGYLIRVGTAPDKLYGSVMVYSDTEYYYRAMTRDTTYYFQIEAFNERGISPRSEVRRVE